MRTHESLLLVLGTAFAVAGVAAAVVVLSGDPCHPGDVRVALFYTAPLLFGLASLLHFSTTRVRFWISCAVSIAITVASGVALFFVAIIEWAETCTR